MTEAAAAPGRRAAGGRRRGGVLARTAAAAAAALAVMAPVIALGANTDVLAAAAALGQIALALPLLLILAPSLPAGFWRRAAPVGGLFLLALGWAAAGWRLGGPPGPRHPAPDAAPLEIVKLAGAGAMALIGALVGADPRRRRRFAETLALLALVWTLAAVWMRQVDPEHVFGLQRAPPSLRFSGTLLNVNAAGCVFGMLALIGLGLAQARLGERVARSGRALLRAAMPVAALGATASACALTASRTAVACTAALGLVLLAAGAARRLRGWTVALALALGLGMVAFSGAVGVRMLSVGADAGGRAWLLGHYAGVAAGAPLTGYGLGSFRAINTAGAAADQAVRVWDFGAAHDAPLQAAIEGGWPWLALLAATAAAMLWQSRPAAWAVGARGALRRSFLAAGALALLCSLVDIALNVPAVCAFACTLLGLNWGAGLSSPAPTARDHPARLG